ncbi:MAG: hypothetical protein U1D96_03505 [Eubacteriales bacterium]|nr:hypothetical protein [Eubacteriales bacterium]
MFVKTDPRTFGLVGSTVICNEVYALSSEDRYTKLVADGLKVFDNGGNLKVHLGKFSATGYGLKVLGGEIYSTRIRSGAPGDTSYTELGAGWAPLTVKVNSRTALDIWADSNWGGMMQFYDTTANDMRGQLMPYNDGMGQGFRISGRTNTGYDYPLMLAGLHTMIFGKPSVDFQNWSGDVDVTVWGNLHVTGRLSAGGSKPARQQTDDFGERYLYARESPDVRYVVEGSATLVDGTYCIELDPVFLQCIEPDTEGTPWLVHLTPCGNANLFVAEVNPASIVIRGTQDVRFAWSLSAVRKGYAGTWLEEYNSGIDELLDTNWEDDLV